MFLYFPLGQFTHVQCITVQLVPDPSKDQLSPEGLTDQTLSPSFSHMFGAEPGFSHQPLICQLSSFPLSLSGTAHYQRLPSSESPLIQHFSALLISTSREFFSFWNLCFSQHYPTLTLIPHHCKCSLPHPQFCHYSSSFPSHPDLQVPSLLPPFP